MNTILPTPIPIFYQNILIHAYEVFGYVEVENDNELVLNDVNFYETAP